MTNKDFMSEGIDLKRLALLFKRSVLRILLTTVCGALAGGGIYLLVRELTMETRWQSRLQFHMQFIFDPHDAVEQSYNGYTWNDLIHGDPVIDRIVAAIQQSDEPGWSERGLVGVERVEAGRELVREAIKGEIISDTRLLTVTVTASDPELTAMIRDVTEVGLIGYAADQVEIISFNPIRSTEPERMIWDDRLLPAVIGGGAIALCISLLGWWFYYILDDSLYVISDSEKRYPYPLLGLLVREGTGTGDQPYEAELAENVEYLLDNEGKIALLSVDHLLFLAGDRPERSVGDDQTVLRAKDTFDRIINKRVTAGKRFDTVALSKRPEGGLGAALRAFDGVILLVPFGGRNGRKIARTISFLRNQDCTILGIIITEGDKSFWQHYYFGRHRSKA
ncbi:MAG: hypothetical protein LBV33_01060 [Lachnospiraceae bacterium]|jgi:hypothetical protein|nr:hypothetical protein [Lachnospiraceae bacterium]